MLRLILPCLLLSGCTTQEKITKNEASEDELLQVQKEDISVSSRAKKEKENINKNVQVNTEAKENTAKSDLDYINQQVPEKEEID